MRAQPRTHEGKALAAYAKGALSVLAHDDEHLIELVLDGMMPWIIHLENAQPPLEYTPPTERRPLTDALKERGGSR